MKSVHKLEITLFVLFAVIFAQLASPQTARAACTGIVYVDADSTAVSPDGCSWGTAYKTLQDALADIDLESGDQIWVAQGTYYPDEGAGQVNDARDSTFQLLDGIPVYGGFAGTETLLSQRNSDPATNGTVLSGDIGTVSVSTDNAYSVVSITMGGLSATFLLDGFTIQDGNDDSGSGHGGGIYVNNTSPTLRNLIIRDNKVTSNGGGMFVISPSATLRASYSSPTLENVTFTGNTAARGGGLYIQNGNPTLTEVVFTNNMTTSGAGGGMNSQTENSTDEYSIPTLTDVTFENNQAFGGAGLYVNNSNAVLSNVTFNGNLASRRGGGMLIEFSSPSLTNVTFYNNQSNDAGLDPVGGGGLMNITGSPTLKNVTFSGNLSTTAGAIRSVETSSLQIDNSIFWGDTNGEISSDVTSTVTIVDSVVEGGFTGGTNIVTTDPKLGPLATNRGAFTQTMALGVGSSAINAGGVNATCAAADQTGTSRPQGAACDMGAFEFDGITTLTVSPVTDTYGNTVSLTATLESYGTGLDGKTINFTLNGSSVGSAVTNVSGVAVLNSVSLDEINVGVYPGGVGSGVGASFASGDPIFVASSDTDTLTVNQRPITVTAATDTKTYDGTADSAGAPTITFGSLAGDDTASWSQSFDNENVGTNKVLTPTGNVTDGNGGANYSITFTPVSTGTITAKNLTVTGITANNKEYDGNTTASLNLGGASLVGVVGGDDVTPNTSGATGTFNNKNVATGKTVTVSGVTLDGTDAGNYTVTQPTTTADITPRGLNVTATASNKVYDSTTSATASLFDDRLGGDDLTLAYTGASFLDPNVGPGKTVNVTGISISGGIDAGNYSLISASTSTTADITERPITVTADSGQTKVYGDTDPTFTYQVTSGSLVGADVFNGALDRMAGEDVDTYAIQQGTLSAGSNYDLTFVPADFAITKATLTVTADDQSIDYGDPDPAFTFAYSGFVGGDTSAVLDTEPTCTVVGPHTNSGTYPITCSGGADNNYDFSYVNGALSVVGITVTPNITANDKTYDGNASAAFTCTLTGVVGGDDVSCTGGTASFADKNAGVGKLVTATGLSLAGADLGNYTLSSTSATTTADITPRGLDVTATGVNKVYDAAATATVSLSDNRLVGDSLTLAYTSASFPDPNVGSGKTVNVTGVSISGGTDAGNYSLNNTSTSTTADITARPITVTANNGQSKVYGSANPTLTYQVTSGSLAGADAFNGALSRIAGENVGAYAIQQGTLSAGSNYNLTFVPADFIITKATLTVTADNQGIDFGDPDPVFTFAYSGFVSGDTSAVLDTEPTCTVVGPHTSSGTYPITCSGGADNNYNFSYVNGVLTVALSASSFEDVDTSYWAWQFIERLYNAGITGGCSVSPLNYCPENEVTRAQMAIFLERGMAYPASFNPPDVAPTFGDTVGHWAEDWIEALKNDGITSGCAIGLYCPDNPVTRAQMAVFLLKAKYGSSYNPPAVGASTGFGDVAADHWAAAWIKQLAAENITGGCGGGNYCPESPVTRAQMAVFLVRTFNLP